MSKRKLTLREEFNHAIARVYHEALCDHNHRFNHKKAGEWVVGVTWTRYMWRSETDSVEMWLAYAAVLLTWSTAGLLMKKFGRQEDAAPSKGNSE